MRASSLLAIAVAAALWPGVPVADHDDIVFDAEACTLTVEERVIPLQGKYQVVDAFPDFTVQIVTAFPDLRVQEVTAFPDACGKWMQVESFPDFKIQFVTAFPDLKIQRVMAFPGAD